MSMEPVEKQTLVLFCLSMIQIVLFSVAFAKLDGITKMLNELLKK